MKRYGLSDRKYTLVKKICCPKCWEIPMRLTELWNGHAISFDRLDNNQFDEGVLNPGDPDHVQAECKCGYHWRLRNTCQVTDILS